MRLNLRLKKAIALASVVAITATTVPAMAYASDYDKHWAKETITKWSGKGVLKGYEDGTFKPSEKVTRGELAAILVRVFGLLDTTSATKYTDVEDAKWYAKDIAKVSSAGIMNDYEDGTFKPEQEATREEAAYAIAKAYKVVAKDTNLTFKDQADISDWAEGEIASLVAGGYLNGNPDGTFKPQASLTRAEAVTMVDKITADLVNVAGIYSQDIDGHLVVNTANVELKDMVITGNLYLAEGIGEGDVKLNNVTVLGDIIVEGGGISTVHINGQSKLNNIIVNKAGKNPVRVLLGNLIEVQGIVTLRSTAHIEGNAISLKEIIVDGALEPQIIGNMKIEQVMILLPTELVLIDGVIINQLTVGQDAINTIIRGRGEKSEIKNILVKANGLELKKGFKYNKDKVVVDKAVTTLPKYPESGGGGGGGGGGSTPSVKDKEINVSALQIKVEGTATPKKVEIKNNKVNIVVNSKEETVTINDVAFGKEAVIESITAIEDHGTTELTVSLKGTYPVALKPGTAYDLVALKGIAKDKEKLVYDLLGEVAELSNLTAEQEAKANELLGKAFERFYKNTSIKVSDLLEKAEALKDAATAENIEKAYEKLENALNKFGVSVNDFGPDTFSAEGQLTVNATSAHETDTITVNVAYK